MGCIPGAELAYIVYLWQNLRIAVFGLVFVECWGFGRDGQESQWDLGPHRIVEVIGQDIGNGKGCQMVIDRWLLPSDC